MSVNVILTRIVKVNPIPDEYLKDVKPAEDLTFALAAKHRLVVGSPNDSLEQLLKWKEEIRPDYLILRLRTARRATSSQRP